MTTHKIDSNNYSHTDEFVERMNQLAKTGWDVVQVLEYSVSGNGCYACVLFRRTTVTISKESVMSLGNRSHTDRNG